MPMYYAATSAWRDWYRFSHLEKFSLLTGNEFESYVTDALKVVHGPGFINPIPKGQLGDYGCDGITHDGKIAYACYGYLPNRASEQGLSQKVQGDFNRAESKWEHFDTWRFVSNVGFGPIAAQTLNEINRSHGPDCERTIAAQSFDKDAFWRELLLPLPVGELDKLFPGVPNSTNVSLEDLYPLLDTLGSDDFATIEDVPVGPVSPEKMKFNELSQRVQLEFNTARVHVPAIQAWFAGHDDPTLRDSQGNKFRAIYLNAKETAKNSNEIIERLYVSLGGSNFRQDDDLANAVYAVTAFFFDECDIFEAPPVEGRVMV